MIDITKLPPLVQYAISGLTTVIGLFASQGLISNGKEKLIAGTAAIVIPLGYLILVAVMHAAHTKATALITVARINQGHPTEQTLPPA